MVSSAAATSGAATKPSQLAFLRMFSREAAESATARMKYAVIASQISPPPTVRKIIRRFKYRYPSPWTTGSVSSSGAFGSSHRQTQKGPSCPTSRQPMLRYASTRSGSKASFHLWRGWSRKRHSHGSSSNRSTRLPVKQTGFSPLRARSSSQVSTAATS